MDVGDARQVREFFNALAHAVGFINPGFVRHGAAAKLANERRRAKPRKAHGALVLVLVQALLGLADHHKVQKL